VNDPLDDNTRRLTALLNGRENWRFERFDDEDHWLFGVDGEARLVITPEMDGFLMYRPDRDNSWVISRIEQVEEWLIEHEHEHAGLSATGESWKRAAEELRRKNNEEGGAA
jgi:hypothetical protein